MVETKFNAKALSLRSAQRIDGIRSETLRAEHQNAESMRRQAQRLSSGNVPARYLKREAHRRKAGLYSRRSPSPPQDPAIINAQSTRFKRSWRVYLRWLGTEGTSISLWNTSPYAKFMLGTARMMARPLLQRLMERERAPRLARLAEAKRQAMKGR